MAGLALTYAMATAGYLSFCIQDFCVVEVNIVSVERINEVCSVNVNYSREIKKVIFIA
jgi:hypothetical protein